MKNILLTVFTVCAMGLTAAPITTLENTGLGGGTTDPNWTLVGGTAFVTGAGFPIPPWLANTSTSAWISPSQSYAGGQTDPQNTTFRFQNVFSLAGLMPSTASISFRAAADNQITAVLLNGNNVGYTNTAGFGALSSLFTVNNPAWFQAGSNTIEFQVLNLAGTGGNPAGLRVEISGTADLAGNPVPEPATYALLGAGLAVIGLARRKR